MLRLAGLDMVAPIVCLSWPVWPQAPAGVEMLIVGHMAGVTCTAGTLQTGGAGAALRRMLYLQSPCHRAVTRQQHTQ
jgi:hypothetical protein